MNRLHNFSYENAYDDYTRRCKSWKKELEAIKRSDDPILGNEVYYRNAQDFCDMFCNKFIELIKKQ